jgi:hypothetical protein
MPLDRRDSFCGVVEPEFCAEDPRKNFIPFSATTAVRQKPALEGTASPAAEKLESRQP